MAAMSGEWLRRKVRECAPNPFVLHASRFAIACPKNRSQRHPARLRRERTTHRLFYSSNFLTKRERKSRHIASATCCAQLSSARREPRAPQDLPALIVALDPVSEPRRGFLCSRGSHLPPVAQGLDIASGIGDGRRIG